MSLKIGVGSFEKRSGTGSQTVTGVVDQDGVAFTPVAFIFWTMGSIATSDFSDPARNRVSWGFDSITAHRAVGAQSKDNAPGASILDGANTVIYSKLYSVLVPPFTWTINPQNTLTTAGNVASASSGSFTFTWAFSEAATTGLIVSYLAIGGSGVSAAVGSIATSGGGNKSVTGLAFQPTAVFTGSAVTVGDSNNSGEFYFEVPRGWMNAQGCQGALSVNVSCQSDTTTRTYRVQRNDKCVTALTYLGGSTTQQALATFVSMNSDGFTVNYSVNATDHSLFYLALAGCSVSVGSFSRPSPLTDTGSRITGLGVDPVAVLLASVGDAASSAGQTDARISMSAHTTTDQVGKGDWFGSNDNVSTSVNASYHAETGVIAADPVASGASSTLLSEAQSLIMRTDGFDVLWAASPVETVSRQYLYAAFAPSGTTPAICPSSAIVIPPTPPPDPGETRYIRRVRVFPLPFARNLRISVPYLEVLPQPGVGLTSGQGSDPQLMMRISKDGGMTYGNEISMSVGKIGEYFHRWYVNRLGQGRNWVVELSATDPVEVYWLECFVEAEEGLN